MLSGSGQPVGAPIQYGGGSDHGGLRLSSEVECLAALVVTKQQALRRLRGEKEKRLSVEDSKKLVACCRLLVVVVRVATMVNIMVLDKKVNSIVEDLVLPKLQQ